MSYFGDILIRAVVGSVVLIGCGGDGNATDGSESDATSTTDDSNSQTESTGTQEPTTENPTTGSESDSGSTEEPTTENPTTGGPTDPTTEDPTTEEPTTEEPTTEDPTTEDPTEDPSESETTTDGGKMCGVADGDYGTCEAVIGYAFNGEYCELRSGCGCEDDCDLFFDDLSECTSTCADAGFCNTGVFSGEALAEDPFVQGNFCDEVDVCTPNSVLDDVELLFPDLFSCEGNGFPCDQQGFGQKCTVQWSGEVGPEIWEQLCEASLVPDINKIACVIWGP